MMGSKYEEERDIYALPARPVQASSPSSSSGCPKHGGGQAPDGQIGGTCEGHKVRQVFGHACRGKGVRRYIGVQQDMPILEVLQIRACLEMFLERVATLMRRSSQRGLVDRHDGRVDKARGRSGRSGMSL